MSDDIRSGNVILWFFLLTYLTGAFLTGAWHWNHVESKEPQGAFSATGSSSFSAGAIWPLYWAARGALEVTK